MDVVIRPEDIDVVASGSEPVLPGSCHRCNYLTSGVHYEIIVDVRGFKWMIQSTDYQEPVGAKIGASTLSRMHIHIMQQLRIFRNVWRLQLLSAMKWMRIPACFGRGGTGTMKAKNGCGAVPYVWMVIVYRSSHSASWSYSLPLQIDAVPIYPGITFWTERRVYSDAFGRSIWLGAIATAVCLLLGYPLAYVISRMQGACRSKASWLCW